MSEPSDDQFYSINQLADLCQADRRTLREYLKGVTPARFRNGFPVYRLEDALKAVRENRQKKSSKSTARDRLLRLQADKIETQLAILKKEFVPANDVERWGAELGAAIRKIITQLHLCAPQVVGVSIAEAESRLKEVEFEALEQLHLLQTSGKVNCPRCGADIFETP